MMCTDTSRAVQEMICPSQAHHILLCRFSIALPDG